MTSLVELGIAGPHYGARTHGQHLSTFIIFTRNADSSAEWAPRAHQRKKKHRARALSLIESDTISENNRCPLVALSSARQRNGTAYLPRFHVKPFVVLEPLQAQQTTVVLSRRIYRSKLFTNSLHLFFSFFLSFFFFLFWSPPLRSNRKPAATLPQSTNYRVNSRRFPVVKSDRVSNCPKLAQTLRRASSRSRWKISTLLVPV